MDSANASVKKRANDRGNELIWAYDQQDFVPCSYGDRFIPRRYCFRNINHIQNMFQKKDNIETDILKSRSEKAYWRRHNYEANLCKVFDLKEKRIYQFHDSNVSSTLLNKYNITPKIRYPMDMNNNVLELDWPCKPRSRPLVCADSTHDLPNFANYSGSNILSWSKKGQVAASFGTDLVIWTPDTDETVLYKIGFSKALAFCPKGTYIAVGSVKHVLPVLRLWDLGCDNLLIYTNHVFFQLTDEKISCIEWLPTGNVILCGTAAGTIYVLSVPSLRKIKYLKHNQRKIVSIKFNPKSNYFATSDCAGNVYIYFWPNCKLQTRIRTNGFQRLIDWHPWNGTDLAICEVFPASIRIVNVVKNEVVASYTRRDSNCYIDALSFNKISGELVVSYLIKESTNFVCEIFVMASLNRIVDVLNAHEDRVKILLWNPDGTQLATAGDDDTLTIWNFFAFRDKKLIRKPIFISNEPIAPINRTSLSGFGLLK